LAAVMVVATAACAGDPASEINRDSREPSKMHDKIAAFDRAIRVGEWELAIQGFGDVIRLDPNDDRAYHNRGYAYMRLGEYERAVQEYDKAIQLDPIGTFAYSYRGLAYAELGQYERAVQDYDKVIQLYPESASANDYKNRGAAYSGLGQHQRAIQDYNQAIRRSQRTGFTTTVVMLTTTWAKSRKRTLTKPKLAP